MPRNEASRPEWFKLFRRARIYLDNPVIGVDGCGKAVINALRYFDGEAELLQMNNAEQMAFYILKSNVDDSFKEFEIRAAANRENGKKGGRPEKEYDPDEAEELYRELGSWEAVAKALCMDRSTVYRKNKAIKEEKAK